jgi:hypothetical protein
MLRSSPRKKFRASSIRSNTTAPSNFDVRVPAAQIGDNPTLSTHHDWLEQTTALTRALETNTHLISGFADAKF